MITSMTGFASRTGQIPGASWQWDLRSVNGKGMDLRLRLPDWIDGLEPAVRAELSRRVQRGNVALTLRLQRDGATEAMRLNRPTLDHALGLLSEVMLRAEQRGLVLSPPSSADIVAMRGVIEQSGAEGEDTAPLRAALLADLGPLLDDFQASRRAEGTSLEAVLSAQVARIAELTRAAAAEVDARRDAMAQNLLDALARILDHAEGVDEARLAQELAFQAVKADVTEEIDRLTAHVEAARALLADPAPVGRKLDFLSQEFNREANTLCSKAQHIGLTRIGLDLKSVIDQMREQIQNVE